MNEKEASETPKDSGGLHARPTPQKHERVGAQDDAPGVRNGARNGAVAGQAARNSEPLPQEEQPSLLRPSPIVQVSERDAEGEVVHRAADDVSLVPSLQSTSLVGRNDGGVPVERADDLAVRGLRGTPQGVLKQAGNALLAVAFQAANTAKRGMEEAENDAAKAAFARITGDLVLKMYEMGYGKQVKHTFDIKSQEDLPAWNEVPADVRAALEKYVAGAEVDDK